jgi:hypothetical protein
MPWPSSWTRASTRRRARRRGRGRPGGRAPRRGGAALAVLAVAHRGRPGGRAPRRGGAGLRCSPSMSQPSSWTPASTWRRWPAVLAVDAVAVELASRASTRRRCPCGARRRGRRRRAGRAPRRPPRRGGAALAGIASPLTKTDPPTLTKTDPPCEPGSCSGIRDLFLRGPGSPRSKRRRRSGGSGGSSSLPGCRWSEGGAGGDRQLVGACGEPVGGPGQAERGLRGARAGSPGRCAGPGAGIPRLGRSAAVRRAGRGPGWAQIGFGE